MELSYFIARLLFSIGASTFLVLIVVTLAQSFWICIRERASDRFEPKYRHFIINWMALATWILIATDVCLVVSVALGMARGAS